ncbi:MAG: hypothetical protein E6175_07565 [Anaerococcus sp.]|nr:hypothetical protein [Anaerococcus sp.]
MDPKESLSEKLARLSGNAVNRMYEIAENTKTNYDIGESKKKLIILYQEVGKYYYQENKENAPEELKAIFDEIALREEEIKNYNPKDKTTVVEEKRIYEVNSDSEVPLTFESKSNSSNNMDDIINRIKSQES